MKELLFNSNFFVYQNSVRTTKIGATGNYDGKSYVIHFLQEDKIDGNVRVTIVGQNISGFTMAYAKDSETVIDAEFSALPSDEWGTLVIIQEETDRQEKAYENTNVLINFIELLVPLFLIDNSQIM